MKKWMIYFGTLLTVCLLLGGCWDRRELEELAFTAGTGVDLDQTTNQVNLSFQIVKPSEIKSPNSDVGSGGGSQAFYVIESFGKTPFEAVRKVAFKNSRRLDFTHNTAIIFGKNVAAAGIRPYLDFFVRDPEPRPLQWILFTEENPGAILKTKPDLDKFSAMTIDGFIKNAGLNSEINQLTLQELVNCLLSKTQAAAIPVIKTTGEDPNKKLVMNGSAIFKKGKMVGKINPRETRGLLWLKNKVNSGIIVISVTQRDKVSLEIIRASGSFKPKRLKDKLIMKITIRLACNIGGELVKADMLTPAGIKTLENKAKQEIKKEIMAAVRQARKLKADIFGFGEAFGIKYPKWWKTKESKWESIFPRIRLVFDIKVNIRLLGETVKPLTTL